MPTGVSYDRKKVVTDWLEIPAGEQTETAHQLRKRLRMSYQTLNNIRKDWLYKKEYDARTNREVRKVQSIIEQNLSDASPIEVTINRRATKKVDLNEAFDEPTMPDSEEEQVEEVLNALWNMSVARKNVFASKIWLQAKGQLIERREDKIQIGFDADEIARRNLEAERRLRERHRMDDVKEKRPLLPDPARPDNQQEHQQDSKVGSVGVSS